MFATTSATPHSRGQLLRRGSPPNFVTSPPPRPPVTNKVVALSSPRRGALESQKWFGERNRRMTKKNNATDYRVGDVVCTRADEAGLELWSKQGTVEGMFSIYEKRVSTRRGVEEERVQDGVTGKLRRVQGKRCTTRQGQVGEGKVLERRDTRSEEQGTVRET